MKSRKTKSPGESSSGPPIRPIGLRVRHAVEWAAVAVLRAAARRMPLGLLRLSADLIGTLAASLDYRGAPTARENLRVVFGSRFTPRQRRALVRASYRHFARIFLEMFWNPNLTPELSRRWCPMVFEDEAATEAASRAGGIFITPHYGNFEWLAIAWSHLGHPLTIIAQDFKNPRITPIFAADRSVSGNHIVSQQGALLKLLRALKRGEQVALLPDLTTSPRHNAAIIRTFGLKASVTSLPASLAVRTGCPVVPAISIPQPDGTYLCHIGRPMHFPDGTSLATAAQACWDVFEPVIRRHPASWLWMYKHWRFLPIGASPASYPDYANRSSYFDKLEREMQI